MLTLAKLIKTYVESKKGDKSGSNSIDRLMYEALESIGRSHYTKYQRSIGEDAAADVIIKTIARLMMGYQVFDTDKNIDAYVHTCFRNAFLAELRNKKHETSVDEINPTHDVCEYADPWEKLAPEYLGHNQNKYEYKELVKEVKRLLAKLGATRREVVALRLLEGYSPAEIMCSLGLNRNQVDNAYCTGIKQLRKLMDECFDG